MAPKLKRNWPESDQAASDIKAVEDCLADTLSHKTSQAEDIDPHYHDLLNQVGNLIGRGGKRIRPRLVLKSYQAFGGDKHSSIIKVAASQELFHAFILMHDDIIDRDVMRWGGPNISGHYLFEFQQYLNQTDARHYADSWALLAGDLCYNLSNELLISSGFNPGYILKAVGLVQQTMFTMVGGELADVALPIYHDEALEDKKLLCMYENKTAAYSFCTPLQLGAMLAGAGASQLKQLNDFGRYIGVAFQIRDDVLGIFGNERSIGKSNLSDIRQNKRTLLINFGLRLGTEAQVQKLHTILGNPGAEQAELDEVRNILRVSGALKKTTAVMENYCQQAHMSLLKAKLPQELCDYLAELPPFCAQRSY
jgi:geranylgeranyl diphosphate synthase, type II